MSSTHTLDSDRYQTTDSKRLDKLGDVPLYPDGPSWRKATDGLRADISQLSDDDVHDSGEKLFSPLWAKRQQARFFDTDEWAREWTESTILLSPTAGHYLPGTDDIPVPPLQHLEALNESSQARQKALSRILSDVGKWRAIRVYGPTKAGYVAPHVGIYVSEPIPGVEFESYWKAHIENCPLASRDSHGTGATSIESDPARSQETGLMSYLAKNVPSLDTTGDKDHGLLDEDPHRMRTAAVLRESGTAPIKWGKTGGSLT